MSNLTGKTALVTGGTGGLGTAICRRLARDGRRVVASCHPDDLAGLAAWQQARRDEGLPGLAIGWGPIADQGYLARAKDTRALLERRLDGALLTGDLVDIFEIFGRVEGQRGRVAGSMQILHRQRLDC